MNRISVLACINRHLHAARMEPGGLRPLGELVPHIAGELRSGIDTADIQASITPMPLVAAFVDGVITSEEELAVCQSILVDNSVLAELVASVLALDEIQPTDALPPLSSDLSARLFDLTLQLMPNNASGSIEVPEEEQVNAPDKTQPERPSPLPATQLSIKASKAGAQPSDRKQTKAIGLGPALAILAMAASLMLIAWWTIKSSSLWREPGQVVQVPPQPEGREAIEAMPPNGVPQMPREDGLAVQTPEETPAIPPEQLPPLTPPMPQDAPQLVVVPPSVPPSIPPVQPVATPLEKIQWSKIAGLLARRDLNSDYADEAGWHGVSVGDDIGAAQTSDATQLRTLPLSRAEAEVTSGGRIVLAADTRLTLTQAVQSLSAKIDLSHGLIAFVDMPQDTVLEFTDEDRPLAIVRWTTPKATLLVTITDAGLQAQVTGGEVTINQHSVRNSIVAVDSQSVNELKDRNMRLPAWVTRPVETIPLPKTVLAQLAGSSNITETLDRILEATAATGEADNGRLMLSSWRASLSDSNLLRIAENRSSLVRMQALQRMLVLPEWDVRYKHSWAKFSTTINNEVELVFLRQVFELTRRGGKLNAIQISHLVSLLESAQVSVRSLSDFILRKNLGGGPQFDPNLTPQANTRGVGLWRRYINAIRNSSL